MRLDYSLYVLAAVFFIITAALFVLITDNDSLRNMISAATIVVGILLIGGGYFVKPKPEAAPVYTAPAPVAAPVTAEVAEEPKPEAPVKEAEAVEASPEVEAPEPEAAPMEPAATPVDAAPVSAPTTEGTPLTQIRGINEKRAEQMKSVGVNSVEDLAKASPEDLAAKLEVSPRIVKMWVGTAKKMVK